MLTLREGCVGGGSSASVHWIFVQFLEQMPLGLSCLEVAAVVDSWAPLVALFGATSYTAVATTTSTIPSGDSILFSNVCHIMEWNRKVSMLLNISNVHLLMGVFSPNFHSFSTVCTNPSIRFRFLGHYFSNSTSISQIYFTNTCWVRQ